uniref:Tpd52 like 2a n=1 Tax=Amphilophus citrinellus TaxID=61819 RepID=A0A3Q0RW25_AMPCI
MKGCNKFKLSSLALKTDIHNVSCIDCFGFSFPFSQTEDEIQTLRQVLLAKEKYAADIRRQLGMSSLTNIKQSLSKGWQEVQTSSPYVRTRDSLSHAGQVTSAAVSSVGMAITRRLAQMRHSSTFRSFEDMVGNMKVNSRHMNATLFSLLLIVLSTDHLFLV